MTAERSAIRVHNLGKKYRLGGPVEKYSTIRDTIADSVRSHFRNFRSTKPQEFWALKGLSFDVEYGEVVGVIGRNGAGKSTLLKILSRITTPTEGSIEIFGRVGSLLEVGTGFHPELTGRENIYLSGSLLGMKTREIDAKMDEIVKFSEIGKFLDTPVKRFSSGMHVRLAFAVAAHMETEILLIDEVLAVGDVAFQRKSLKKMKMVTSEGRTVMIVSHSMPIIRNNCDRVLYLKNGRLEKIGSPEKVVTSYLTGLSSDSPNLSKEVTPDMHLTGISKIVVKKIQITDENGTVLKNVKYHQPIIIEAFIEVKCNVENVGFGIVVSTNDNVMLLQTHCFDKSGVYWDMRKGDYKIRITVVNQLKKGFYSLQFGAHQKPFNVSLLDIPNALLFEVTDEPFDRMDHYSQYNAGLIDTYSEWTLMDS